MTATSVLPTADELSREGRRALLSAPLTAGAARLLGLSAELRGDHFAGTKLHELAERISRRDFRTQLALIELAVERGDVAGALRHHDIALRTRAGGDALLFPILASAIEDPAVRGPFAAIMATSPPWLGAFFASTLRAGGHSAAVAALVDRVGGLKSIDRSGQLDGLLLQGLANDRHYEQLRQRYLTMPGAGRDVLTAVRFDTAGVRPDRIPISWQIIRSEPLLASFTKAETGGNLLDLSISLDPGNQALVARKLLFLPAGAYRFRAAVRSTEWTADSTAWWVLKCALTKDEPVIWEGRPLGGDVVALDARPVVGAACPVQFLDLVVAAGADGQTPLELVAASPTLVRDGSAAAR